MAEAVFFGSIAMLFSKNLRVSALQLSICISEYLISSLHEVLFFNDFWCSVYK